MNILVFGVGAIGTYIGGNLGLAGHTVVFLEKEQNISFLEQQGLIITDKHGSRCLEHPVIAGTVQEALGKISYDLSIMAVKSYDTNALLAQLQPYQKDIPPVLCLQNGVENEGKIAAILGEGKVIAGTVTSAIGRNGLGNITVERERGVGVALNHPLSSPILEVFQSAGFNARGYSHPASMKWSKMLSNLPANATAAIFNMTPQEIYQNPDSFSLEIRMMREALDVMEQKGIKAENLPGTPIAPMAFIFRWLPAGLSQPLLMRGIGGGRGGKMPSFHIDLYHGAKNSEVEFLNGAVVRAAAELGIDTPINQKLTETLVRMASGEEDLHEFDHQPGKFMELFG